jgi:ribosomal protein L35AE/L33A
MKIHKSPLPSNKILWPELYFAAEASKEAFQEMTIINAPEHEFVKIENCEIKVGIKSNVSDEDVVWKALDMVAEALDRLDGRDGVVYFGADIQLSTPDTTSEYLH